MQITLRTGYAACSSVQKLDASVTPCNHGPGKVKDLPSRPLRTDGLRELHINVPLNRLASFYRSFNKASHPLFVELLRPQNLENCISLLYYTLLGGYSNIQPMVFMLILFPSQASASQMTAPSLSIDSSQRCCATVASLHVTMICIFCVTGILIPPIEGIIMHLCYGDGFQTTMPSRDCLSPCFTLRHIPSSAQLIACSTKYTPPVTLVYACQERYVNH
ncbi:hypothetical protein N5P37_009881 [Trichoderma harzianum]|nr:hypothetical protein N5P37_009881 [Trichoderma harzianum]